MSRIEVGIQGESPLLMNRFTERAAEQVSVGTSQLSVGGRRGTPREQAEDKLYLSADKSPMIPAPNVFRGLIDAGAFQKAGKRQVTTAKASLVPAGVMIDEIECKIINPFGRDVVWEVDSRSVVIPSTGGRIMCHRPRFDAWRINFALKVNDTLFDERVIRRLVDDLGTKIGLGDFRPSRKGPFGRFFVVHWARKEDVVHLSKTA